MHLRFQLARDQTSGDFWATIAIALVLVGYVVPTLYELRWPTFQLVWGYSALEVLLISFQVGGLMWLLLLLPAILAGLGGLGFGCSKNIWHLRYGFLPTIGLSLVYVVLHSSWL